MDKPFNFQVDVRDLQILALSLFLTIGLTQGFDFTIHPNQILTAIVVTLITQYLANRFLKRQETAALISRSALITALGLSLLLRSTSLIVIAIAACCAILSKFLIRYRGKHLFNPANFGIIAVLCFTEQAWISPGQWGDSFSLALLFVGIGGVILSWLGRWETTIVFLIVYALGIAFRNLWLGFEVDILWHELTSGSLLVFAFFMLSDPRSIPDHPLARVIWSSAIALLTLILKYQFFLATAPFWALFFLSILTPWLDSVWQGKQFNWKTTTYSWGENNHETAKL